MSELEGKKKAENIDPACAQGLCVQSPSTEGKAKYQI